MSTTQTPTFLVLGGFLESSWEESWQRQQEWVRQLQMRGNVLYLERAAAGTIRLQRVLGRMRKMNGPRPCRPVVHPFPPKPVFVPWTQVPSNLPALSRKSAQLALAAAERARRDRGWGRIELVHVGTPAEPWIELASAVDCPVWFDMAERFLYSAAYENVSRKLMRRQIADATLVTTDTDITRKDWPEFASRVRVIPHGAKSWAAEPLWGVSRRATVYLGTHHPALDYAMLRSVARMTGTPVEMVGEYPAPMLSGGLVEGGWSAGGDVPDRISRAIAGLVPYTGAEWREGIYPSKVYDYWLAGLPAVTTRLPALDGLSWAWQCDTPEEMCAAVERAVALRDDERREIRRFALANTWDARFETVAAVLHALGVKGFEPEEGGAVAG